jgi:hypothetical protein
MATEWFIYRGDERGGPYTSAEIRGLARRGELQPSDWLWKVGMPEKQLAGNSPKLFPAAAGGRKPAAAHPEAEPESWFDDPRLVRPALLIAGAVSLMSLATALAIAFWPAREPAIRTPASSAQSEDHGRENPRDAADGVAEQTPPAINPQHEHPVEALPVVVPPPPAPPQRSPPIPGVPDDF